MTPIEVEAKTLEDAIEIACEKLGRAQDELEIEVLSKGSSGIFGLVGAKNVRISARPRQEDVGPAREPAKRAKEAAEEDAGMAEDAAEEDAGMAEDAAEILRSILSHFSLKTEVTSRMEGQTAYLDVNTDNPGLLIGRKAQTLEAFQYIVSSMMSRRMAKRARVVVDVEGYRTRKKSAPPSRKRNAGQKPRDNG